MQAGFTHVSLSAGLRLETLLQQPGGGLSCLRHELQKLRPRCQGGIIPTLWPPARSARKMTDVSLSMKSVLNNSIRATSCSRSAGQQQQHAMAVLQQRDDVHTLIQQLTNAANFNLPK